MTLKIFMAPPKRAIGVSILIFFCTKKHIRLFDFGVETSNVENRLKHVFPKFHADRSHGLHLGLFGSCSGFVHDCSGAVRGSFRRRSGVVQGSSGGPSAVVRQLRRSFEIFSKIFRKISKSIYL